MNVYCFDCKTLICKTLICLYCNIKAHNNESVKVAVSDTKKKLLQKLSSLSDTKAKAVKIVQATKATVTAV